MNRYDECISRKRHEHGDRFDDSELENKFVPYFNSGERIRVSRDGHTRTGRLGVTTGWRPAFLLMHRSSDHSSSDLLSSRDEVTHVQRGRKYTER